jgi:hypothetical protein
MQYVAEYRPTCYGGWGGVMDDVVGMQASPRSSARRLGVLLLHIGSLDGCF